MSRRGFLTLSAAGLLVACGSGSAGDGDGAATGTATGGGRGRALVRYFPDGIHVAGRPERLPFGVADAEGIPLSEGPASLSFTIVDDSGKQVQAGTVERHRDGIPRAYYPIAVELPAAGIYTLRAEVDGVALDSAISAVAPGSLGFPGAGERLPAFDTPTVADPRGVDPVCTRPEACPFHTQTLTAALAAGRPVAYLVGTPAHCQTGICGPVLDLLVDAAPRFPGISFVHAEVFSDPDGRKVAPAVSALGLDFEPLLFVTGPDGVVRRRLDVICDRAELLDALSAASR